MHGGRAPQVKLAAEERMRELVNPAIMSLARQIDNDEFPAAKFVLEWAGFKATEKTVTEGVQRILVEYGERVIGLPEPSE